MGDSNAPIFIVAALALALASSFSLLLLLLSTRPADASQELSTGLMPGSTARYCWPGDALEVGACGTRLSCRAPVVDCNKQVRSPIGGLGSTMIGCGKGKCNGGRVILWDGAAWKACKWTGGDAFDCTPGARTDIEVDSSKIFRPT